MNFVKLADSLSVSHHCLSFFDSDELNSSSHLLFRMTTIANTTWSIGVDCLRFASVVSIVSRRVACSLSNTRAQISVVAHANWIPICHICTSSPRGLGATSSSLTFACLVSWPRRRICSA